MNQLRSWKQYIPGHRVLLLFAPRPSHRLYQWQVEELLTDWDGLEERNVQVLHFYSKTREMDEPAIWTDQSAQEAFRQFKVSPNQFAFILIDKDGREKFRREYPVELRAFFIIVDVMPSRKAELRDNS